MSAPKGNNNNPNGRPKGAVNKSTALAREAIARFVDGNVDRLEGWLDQIALQDPKAAFTCFMDVVEYHVPKLQRTEIVGDKENPLVHQDVTTDILGKLSSDDLQSILAARSNVEPENNDTGHIEGTGTPEIQQN